MCDWRDYPSYLAPFPIESSETPLDIWLNPKSVVTFNSIQRPEEHFYPTSLSFGLIEFSAASIHKLQWGGLQNNAIKKLSSTGAVAILVPDDCFAEFLEASLIPQLSDQNYHANPSKVPSNFQFLFKGKLFAANLHTLVDHLEQLLNLSFIYFRE